MDILDIARKNQQKAWEIIKKINVSADMGGYWCTD